MLLSLLELSANRPLTSCIHLAAPPSAMLYAISLASFAAQMIQPLISRQDRLPAPTDQNRATMLGWQRRLPCRVAGGALLPSCRWNA